MTRADDPTEPDTKDWARVRGHPVAIRGSAFEYGGPLEQIRSR